MCKPPLKVEGHRRRRGGGSLWNLLLDVLGFTEVPLSQACGLPAQHKARPSGALSGEPKMKEGA